jgi:hypothetical protein
LVIDTAESIGSPDAGSVFLIQEVLSTAIVKVEGLNAAAQLGKILEARSWWTEL